MVDRIAAILPEMESGQWFADRWSEQRAAQLQEAMPGLKERASTLVDVLEGARFIFAERPLEPNEKAAAILSGEGAQHLTALVPLLEPVETWTVEAVETVGAGLCKGVSVPSWDKSRSPSEPR